MDEAVRIAVVTRVMIHQTAQSTALLQHLGAMGIRLLSTWRELPMGGQSLLHFNGMTLTTTSPHHVEIRPKLGNGSFPGKEIPVLDWWNQPVMVIDKRPITRRQIVLAAANQDGGAHVDSSLKLEYEKLAAGGALGVLHVGDAEYPIDGGHLMTLRQIGYELLNSGELRALVPTPSQ